MTADTALATCWIGPSVTPLTNLNSGFRVYEVDSAVRTDFFSKRARVSCCWLTPSTDVRHRRRTHVSFDAGLKSGAHKDTTNMTVWICRWRSDVNSFPGLDGQVKVGPTYVYEYNTRAAYGSNITWGDNDPLNATWWHLVTERASPTSFFVTFGLTPLTTPRDGIEPESRSGAQIHLV
jgi:hypothetical protein